MKKEDSVFQFTLPCRERPEVTVNDPALFWFQFTLPCRERLNGEGRKA